MIPPFYMIYAKSKVCSIFPCCPKLIQSRVPGILIFHQMYSDDGISLLF